MGSNWIVDIQCRVAVSSQPDRSPFNIGSAFGLIMPVQILNLYYHLPFGGPLTTSIGYYVGDYQLIYKPIQCSPLIRFNQIVNIC